MSPTVSLCIPAFNAEKTIARTIESIQQQTFTDWDLVVVDNDSTDDTTTIVHQFIRQDGRIRMLQNEENVGIVENWNRATFATTGEFVKLVCADDLLEPTCLAEQVTVLQDPANHSVVLVAAQRKLINEHDGIIRARHGLGRLDGRVPGTVAIRKCVRSGTNPLGEPAAVLVRGDVIRSMSSWSAGWMIDVDMWTRLLMHGDLYALRKPLASFRVFATSWSTSVVNTQYREAVTAYRAMQARTPDVISDGDIFIGRVRAWILNQVRRAVYWNLARKHR